MYDSALLKDNVKKMAAPLEYNHSICQGLNKGKKEIPDLETREINYYQDNALTFGPKLSLLKTNECLKNS